jgi:hypothetical protein
MQSGIEIQLSIPAANSGELSPVSRAWLFVSLHSWGSGFAFTSGYPLSPASQAEVGPKPSEKRRFHQSFEAFF